jgi:hypothetical protein
MTDEAPALATAATSPPASRSRRRTLLILASISIGWKVLVFTLGAALPHWLIADGVDDLPPELQSYGEEARQTAMALWNGPIERYGVVQRVRVISVAPVVATDSDSGCTGLGARVRAYTYFAIPYSEVRTACDRGVVEYRVFRRRHRER